MENNLTGWAGGALVVSEAPLSDGSRAGEIFGFTLVDGQVLSSRFRALEWIPSQQWAVNLRGVLGTTRAIVYTQRNGVTPEIVLLSDEGVYRYSPWGRDTSGGLEELHTWSGTTAHSCTPPASCRTPPVFVATGNRIYFAWGDGGRGWVVDLDRWIVRPFGLTRPLAAPQVQGPASDGTNPNAGGFSAAGRIGTTDGLWTDATGATVGGLDDGAWAYAVVPENLDGNYGPSSALSNPASLSRETANPPGTLTTDLTRRFAVRVPAGPEEVAARVVLRTPNQLRLPGGFTPEPRFVARIPHNQDVTWIDDHPDGELGPMPWEPRRAAPNISALATYNGSLFVASGHMLYWSEQGGTIGATFESFLESDWTQAHPESGPITALFCARPSGAWAQPSPLLVLKSRAVCALAGTYPGYQLVVLRTDAGCAGPNLIQSTPSGDTLFYGAGTFWLLGEGGQIVDVGGDIRRRLARIDPLRAVFGSSRVSLEDREVVFTLPVDGEADPSYQFVWDMDRRGWRFRQDIAVLCQVAIADRGIQLVAGTLGLVSSIWVLGRSHPDWGADAPNAWVYRTGWQSPHQGPLGVHIPHEPRRILLLCEEQGLYPEAPSSLTVLVNWGDEGEAGEPPLSASPDAQGGDLAKPLATWDSDRVWGASYWRGPRPYTQRMLGASEAALVSAVELTGTAPFGIYTTTLLSSHGRPVSSRTYDVTSGV